ncbi:LysR family transcriptional regulator [Cupriavidus numazuensis]|uniref:HTH-type transcriptional regulator DmlR n=1 Tax=Cupriavidus numazuensis TaxID=221992 RepID=A0ABN7PXD3_9BURK|nr:LysR family transcriptional regulator [Cupriavidus numazuensis]CAG2145515.1 HTH-type transcriptional regulator DmlR [Cupriavidus numazuensis]
MEATSLVFFANVVDAGSFAAASRQMGLDRSSVSRRINELEQELGSQLLRRTTRSMELTEAGAFFYERCSLVRAEVDYAQKAMWDLSGSVRGTVTLSCPPMLAREVVAPLTVDFCSQYPMVDLKLILKNHVPDFPGKKVDISLQITDSPAPSVVARKLASVHWLICGSPAYLADKAEPSSPADLARLAWVDQYIRDFLELDSGEDIERVKIRTRLECIDLTLLRRALTEGLGVGVLPDYVAQSALKAGRLRRLMAGYTVQGTPGTTLYAITPPTRYMPAKVKVLLDFIVRAFEGGGGSLAAVAERYAERETR